MDAQPSREEQIRLVSLYETYVRQTLAVGLARNLKGAKAAMLVGSCAYGENYSVRPSSDLELICLFERADASKFSGLLRGAVPYFISGEVDIYKRGIKHNHKNLKGEIFGASLIFWATDFFEKMCTDIDYQLANRFSDESLEGKKVILPSMHSFRVDFERHSTAVDDGYITRYPVHYIDQELFYCMGVPVQNMLAGPELLGGDANYARKNIGSLWQILVERARYEICDNYEDSSVALWLFRRERMSPRVLKAIDEKESSVWYEQSRPASWRQ